MLPESLKISPPISDPISAYGIGGLAVLVAVSWVLLTWYAGKRTGIITAIVLALAMLLSAAVSLSGKLSQIEIFPPLMAVLIVSVIALGFTFGFSKIGRDLANGISLPVLVGFQAFRLPLEFVMHHAYSVGIMPVQLSFSGYNFDVITGLGALIIYIWSKTSATVPVRAVWIWNLWGSYCLIAIIAIAVTTSPMVRLFGDSPENINSWVLFFPYVWLPVVMVTIAIAGHIVIWRKLLNT